MMVSHFLKWIDPAKVSERVAAADARASAYVNYETPFEDCCAAEKVLMLLLDDTSSKVHQALAEALSMSVHGPLQIISVLSADHSDVANVALAHSHLLTDTDFIDWVASGSTAIHKVVADRPVVSMSLSTAIAEVGDAEAYVVLLQNYGTDIAMLSFHRMVERFGYDARLREVLVADGHLLFGWRHLLLVKLGEALQSSPFVKALMGAARAEKVTHDACFKDSLTLIEGICADEHMTLIEHLRLRGNLTASFIIRILLHGKLDFFGAALFVLNARDEPRVKALLSAGQEGYGAGRSVPISWSA